MNFLYLLSEFHPLCPPQQLSFLIYVHYYSQSQLNTLCAWLILYHPTKPCLPRPRSWILTFLFSLRINYFGHLLPASSRLNIHTLQFDMQWWRFTKKDRKIKSTRGKKVDTLANGETYLRHVHNIYSWVAVNEYICDMNISWVVIVATGIYSDQSTSFSNLLLKLYTVLIICLMVIYLQGTHNLFMTFFLQTYWIIAVVHFKTCPTLTNSTQQVIKYSMTTLQLKSHINIRYRSHNFENEAQSNWTKTPAIKEPWNSTIISLKSPESLWNNMYTLLNWQEMFIPSNSWHGSWCWIEDIQKDTSIHSLQSLLINKKILCCLFYIVTIHIHSCWPKLVVEIRDTLILLPRLL